MIFSFKNMPKRKMRWTNFFWILFGETIKQIVPRRIKSNCCRGLLSTTLCSKFCKNMSHLTHLCNFRQTKCHFPKFYESLNSPFRQIFWQTHTQNVFIIMSQYPNVAMSLPMSHFFIILMSQISNRQYPNVLILTRSKSECQIF